MRGMIVILEIMFLILIGQFLYAVAVLGPEIALELFAVSVARVLDRLPG